MSYRAMTLFKSHSESLSGYAGFFKLLARINVGIGVMALIIIAIVLLTAAGRPIRESNPVFSWGLFIGGVIQTWITYKIFSAISALFAFFADTAWDMADSEMQRYNKKRDTAKSFKENQTPS